MKSRTLPPGFGVTVVIVIIFACCSIAANAQVSSLYSFSTDTIGLGTTPLFLPTSGGTMTGGTILAAGGPGSGTYDHVYPDVPIGFTFEFNNMPYTTIGISSNGFAWFGNGSPSATEYNPVSDAFTVDGVVSVFGASLTGRNYADHTGSGALDAPEATIKYQTIGTAPNRIFLVSWNNFTGKSIEDTAYNDTTEDYNNYRLDLFLAIYECTDIVQPMINGNCYPWFSIGTTVVSLSAETGLRGATPADYYNCSASCQTDPGSSIGATDLVPNPPPSGSNATQITPASNGCLPGTLIITIDLSSPIEFDIVGGNPQAWVYNPNSGCFGLGAQEVTTTQTTIFPNPADNTLEINYSGEPNNTTALITDMTGRILLTKSISAQITSIPLDDIANGLYFVNLVHNNASVAVRKLMVER